MERLGGKFRRERYTPFFCAVTHIQASTASKKKIAERYTGPVNESQTAHGIAAITANVEQLISAAETLAAAGIHSLSCALSILAIEEAQKAMLLLGLFYSDRPNDIQQYLERAANPHEEAQQHRF